MSKHVLSEEIIEIVQTREATIAKWYCTCLSLLLSLGPLLQLPDAAVFHMALVSSVFALSLISRVFSQGSSISPPSIKMNFDLALLHGRS